jgi:hypothetical protein
VSRRFVTMVALGALIVLGGCGSDDGSDQRTAEPGASPTASAAPSDDEASALEGTWVTPPIDQGDVERTLTKFGLAKYIDRFNSLIPFKPEMTLILDIHNGEWNLYGKPRGKPREEIDFDAEYVIEGSRVEKIHATGVTTFGWSVSGDVLSLEWLKTTEPSYKGTPDEVFQRALYMTEDFTQRE